MSDPRQLTFDDKAVIDRFATSPKHARRICPPRAKNRDRRQCPQGPLDPLEPDGAGYRTPISPRGTALNGRLCSSKGRTIMAAYIQSSLVPVPQVAHEKLPALAPLGLFVESSLAAMALYVGIAPQMSRFCFQRAMHIAEGGSQRNDACGDIRCPAHQTH